MPGVPGVPPPPPDYDLVRPGEVVDPSASSHGHSSSTTQNTDDHVVIIIVVFLLLAACVAIPTLLRFFAKKDDPVVVTILHKQCVEGAYTMPYADDGPAGGSTLHSDHGVAAAMEVQCLPGPDGEQQQQANSTYAQRINAVQNV